MGRQPKNPEGPRISVTIRLPRPHLDLIDEAANTHKISRSDTVIAFIEGSKKWKNRMIDIAKDAE